MIRVFECIFVEHDLELVTLAAVVCLLACQCTIVLYQRSLVSNARKSFWIASAALSFGTGVWSTHFIAMLAFRSSLPLTYQVGPTVLSAIIAIVMGFGALWMFSQSQRVGAGIVAGLAVASMHFTGMTALDGPIRIEWDSTYLISSILAGLILSTTAFRFADASAERSGQLRFTLILAASICALHFIGMSAMSIQLDPNAIPSGTTLLGRHSMAVSVASVTALVLVFGLMLAYFNNVLHVRSLREEQRLRAYVVKLEATQIELVQRKAELLGALKLADENNSAKSAFLAMMSHELRTPLNAIIGFSELMQMETKGPIGHPVYQEYLHDIRNSGRHLLSVVNGVLDLSKIEAGEMKLDEEAVPMRYLLEECGRMMQPQADTGGVILHLGDMGNNLTVHADRAKLRQVVLNLLSNAIKFTPRDKRIELAMSVDQNGLLLSVSDQGIGIGAGDLQKATEFFGQVDSSLSRKHDGTGLGLPISIRMIEMHGGTLEIHSEKDIGTRVEVRIPVERVIDFPVAPAVKQITAAAG
jgi:signal transduction histidine kinase